MSKINLRLSYKNILILKHSLEQRIEGETPLIERLEKNGITPDSPLYEMYQEYKKENEEHKRCLEALIMAMASGGYRYSCGKESNVFGEKYLEKFNDQFKKQ